MSIVLPALVILFFIVVAVLLLKVDRATLLKRSSERESWGRAKGLVMVDPADSDAMLFASAREPVVAGLYADLRKVAPFGGGTLYNFMKGTVDRRPIRVFDHKYFVARKGRNHPVFNSAVAITLHGACPPFELRPKQIWHRFRELFGGRGVSLDRPSLDRKFYTTSGNETLLRSLLDSNLEESLTRGWKPRIVCTGSALLVWEEGLRDGPRYDQLLGLATAFVSRIEEKTR